MDTNKMSEGVLISLAKSWIKCQNYSVLNKITCHKGGKAREKEPIIALTMILNTINMKKDSKIFWGYNQSDPKFQGN